MIKEVYSKHFPWIRYNFEYDPYSYDIQKNDPTKNVIGSNIEEINSYGYRSDEFKKDHEGIHILFNGCSQTYGTGLLKEEMWTTKILNEISLTDKVSGNFNISYLARGPHNIINETIKYCENFAKPNIIFILFPDHYRFFGKENDYDVVKQYVFLDKDAIKDKSRHISKKDARFWDEVFINTFALQYRMLELYCDNNNIKLVSASWSMFMYKNLERFNLKTFYELVNSNDFWTEKDNYLKNNKGSDFMEVARDNCHFGSAWHHGFYKMMWRFYNE